MHYELQILIQAERANTSRVCSFFLLDDIFAQRMRYNLVSLGCDIPRGFLFQEKLSTFCFNKSLEDLVFQTELRDCGANVKRNGKEERANKEREEKEEEDSAANLRTGVASLVGLLGKQIKEPDQPTENGNKPKHAVTNVSPSGNKRLRCARLLLELLLLFGLLFFAHIGNISFNNNLCTNILSLPFFLSIVLRKFFHFFMIECKLYTYYIAFFITFRQSPCRPAPRLSPSATNLSV